MKPLSPTGQRVLLALAELSGRAQCSVPLRRLAVDLESDYDMTSEQTLFALAHLAGWPALTRRTPSGWILTVSGWDLVHQLRAAMES